MVKIGKTAVQKAKFAVILKNKYKKIKHTDLVKGLCCQLDDDSCNWGSKLLQSYKTKLLKTTEVQFAN